MEGKEDRDVDLPMAVPTSAAADPAGAAASDPTPQDFQGPYRDPRPVSPPARVPPKPPLWKRIKTRMTPVDWGWNHYSCTRRQAQFWKWFCFIFVLLFIGAIVLGLSYEHVQYDEFAIPYNRHSSAVKREVLGPGPHFMGPSITSHRFPSTAMLYDLIQHQVRVRDGQEVAIDLSFQVQLQKETLLNLFDAFGTNFQTTYETAGLTVLREVASQYESEDFFDRRTEIERDIIAQLNVSVQERHAKLIDTQVRRVRLPTALEERLVTIQLRAQQARVETARIQLSEAQSNTTRAVAEARAQVERLHAGIDLEATNEVLNINQVEVEINERTSQLVSALATEFSKNISVFRQETRSQVLDAQTAEALVREQNLADVQLIEAEAERTVAEFEQQTATLELEVERNASLAAVDAARRVAELRTQELSIISNTTATIVALEASAAANASRVIEGAKAEAAKSIQDALHDAYDATGLSATMLMYIEYINSVVGNTNVSHVDVSTPTAFSDLSSTLAV